MHGFGDKEIARVPFGTPDMHGQSQAQSWSLLLFQQQAESVPKDHDVSTESAVNSLAVLTNLSTVTNTTKGSVWDRMMDWEQERVRFIDEFIVNRLLSICGIYATHVRSVFIALATFFFLCTAGVFHWDVTIFVTTFKQVAFTFKSKLAVKAQK